MNPLDLTYDAAVMDLLGQLLELPPEERLTRLDSLAGDDADMRSRLLALLSENETFDASSWHGSEGSSGEVSGHTLPPHWVQRLLGTTVGPWKLVSLLGQGGFGVVFVAEREKPIAQRVALKIIKPGMDTAAVVARFEQERQALAVMEHPNVAKVFDAGATDDGRPYFVMELVSGEPITTYCDKHQLTLRQRLELFLPVCDAIQHAHYKGVIHRDIKPSNVLVSSINDAPLVKVIDFGISKAIAGWNSGQVRAVQGQMIGTPEYMSPEQAGSDGSGAGDIDVDTRTDVYGLGVLLYELLTGSLPFKATAVRAIAMKREPLATKLSREAPRPSTRIGSLGEEANRIAILRQTETARLVADLRDELEWIPLKAIRFDRAERYATPSALAADVKRFLAGEPLEAGPQTAWYRARKLLSHYKTPLAIAAVLAILLIGGIIGTTIGLRRATAARIAEAAARHDADAQRDIALREKANAQNKADVANETLKFFTDMFESLSPEQARGREITVIDVIDRATVDLGKQLKDHPEVKAQLELSLARILRTLNHPEKAAPLINDAMARSETLFGIDSPESAAMFTEFSCIYGMLGRLERVEALARARYERMREKFGEDHPETITALGSHANILHAMRRDPEAEAEARQVLTERLRVFGERDQRTAMAAQSLGTIIGSDRSRISEVVTLYEQAASIYTLALGDEAEETLNIRAAFGRCLMAAERYPDALPVFRKIYEIDLRRLGEDAPNTNAAKSYLSQAMAGCGQVDEALPLFDQAMSRQKKNWGEDSIPVFTAQSDFCRVLLSQNRADDAYPIAREALQHAEKSKYILANQIAQTYVRVLQKLNRNDEAAAVLARYPRLSLPTTLSTTKPVTPSTQHS